MKKKLSAEDRWKLGCLNQYESQLDVEFLRLFHLKIQDKSLWNKLIYSFEMNKIVRRKRKLEKQHNQFLTQLENKVI